MILSVTVILHVYGDPAIVAKPVGVFKFRRILDLPVRKAVCLAHEIKYGFPDPPFVQVVECCRVEDVKGLCIYRQAPVPEFHFPRPFPESGKAVIPLYS